MANRTVLDLLLGRHYCPACGKSAGFRQDDTYGKVKMRWHQFAWPHLFCNACGVKVRGALRPGVWVALPMWLLIAGGGLVGLIDYGVLTGGVMQLAFFVLFLSVGLCVFQAFLQYEIAPHAP